MMFRQIEADRPQWGDVLLVFLPTLQAFYFYNLGVAIFPLLCNLTFYFILSLRLFQLRKIQFEVSRPIVILMILFILLGVLLLRLQIKVFSIIGVILGIIYLLIMSDLFWNRITSLERAIQVTIIIHIIFFFIQAIGWYVFRTYIDFLEPITGEYQRYQMLDIGGFSGIRLTGLYNEPATYSWFVVSLVFASNRFEKPLNMIEKIALITVFITFSLTGIIAVTLFFLLSIFKRYGFGIKALVVAGFIGLLVFLIFRNLIVGYVLNRILQGKDDVSIFYRFFKIFEQYGDMSIVNKLFGMGIGYTGEGNYYTAMSFYLFYFGIIGTIAFLWVLIKNMDLNSISIWVTVYFLVLQISIIVPTYIFFWTIVVVFIVRKQEVSVIV